MKRKCFHLGMMTHGADLFSLFRLLKPSFFKPNNQKQ